MRKVFRTCALAIAVTANMQGIALARPDESARALESRLYAPCCYGGTLDMHDSEVARELRKEVEERLGAGEATSAIQDDFVRRYGDRVIAARSARPFAIAAGCVAIAMVGAAIALGFRLIGWRRPSNPRTRSTAMKPTPKPKLDEFDARLDEELATLD